ncbi:UNVERIFIED_CONTAM: hypothetical protein GTU68_053183 [Idotea baltica]|nr:hypothetical protein [Idotea baltica]
MNDGTYENNIVHRAIANFVIQGGGFELTSTGVEAVTTRAAIADEFSSENSNIRGTLSMAHAGPNTGRSQWFVNVGDNSNLDGVPHTVFGRVIGNGMDIVDAINLDTAKVDLSLQPTLGAFASAPVTNLPYNTLTGTVSVTANSTTLTGNGTLFTSELQVGDIIAVSATGNNALPALRVVSITSDTELIVDVQGDANTTGRTFAIQTAPVLEDFILFSNIGEILDNI